MSQVPNRYFNSPWIADAARNLSSAIAGDPERDAARLQQEQIRANMARQNEADILARENRVKTDRGLQTAAQMVGLDPNDLTGRRALLSSAITDIGLSPELEHLAGKAAPSYETDIGKLDTKSAAQIALLTDKVASAEKIAAAANANKVALADIVAAWQTHGIDTRADTADKDRVGREIVERMKVANGGTPIDITPTESNDMYKNVIRHSARLYDADLDQKDAVAITMLANKIYQKTRDSDVAVKEAYRRYMGKATLKEGDRWGGFGSRGPSTLVPETPMSIEEILGEVAAAQKQATPGGNLSGAFNAAPGGLMQRPFYQQQPQASAAPATAQQTGGPPRFNSLAEAAAAGLQDGAAYLMPDGKTRHWSKQGYADLLAKKGAQ